MLYCENCGCLCQDDICPLCDNEALREVRDDDFCILIECEESMAGMIKGALDDMQIECALVPFGNGARSALGLNLGNYRVYVPYRHYDAAWSLTEDFSTDPTEDLRKKLLENRSRWHATSNFAAKRLKKKLGLGADEDLMACICQAVESAEEILDQGAIGGSAEGGHYLKLAVRGKGIWFDSATFEIFM